MTRLRSLILALVISLLPITALSAEENPLKIGFIVSLTGPLAEFGIAIQNGVQLAQQDYPEVKRVFQPIYEDSEYKSKVAVTNFEKLRMVNSVDAIYVFGGPMSDTLAPLAERRKLPMFSTEYDTRYTRNKKYVIRFANNASDYAEALHSKLSERKPKRFGIIKMENQYHNTLSSAFIDSLKNSDSVEVLYNFQPNDTDFRAVFPTLRSRNFDAVGVYILPTGQNAFFAQARNAGIEFKNLFGTDGFESRALNQGVEEVVEGALFANSAVNAEFKEKYFDTFGNTDQLVHAALAYEFSLLVKDLFRDSHAPKSPDEFMSKFTLEEGRQSVCGTYYYRNSQETGQYFSFPIAVREVRNGEPFIIARHSAP